MASTATALCPTCAELGNIICPGCEGVQYCSVECQHADLPTHRLLCETFKDFGVRPQCKDEHVFSQWALDKTQPDMVRGIYFPVDEKKPRWIWLPAELCNDRSEDALREYIGKTASDKLKLDKVFQVAIDCMARKELTHQLHILVNHAYRFDNSPINQSLLHFTSGRTGIAWSAPMLAFAAQGLRDRTDMDMTDVSTLSHFFIDYWNNTPEHLAGQARKGRKVDGVKIRCDGETSRLGGDKFVAVKVHPSALVFSLKHPSHHSAIASTLGIPLISVKYSFLPTGAEDPGTGYCNNHQAALLHKTIDIHAPSAPLLVNLPGAFGVPLLHWLEPAGDVLLMRQDRKPLRPEVVEALCSFIARELGPLFQCVRADEYYEGLPVTRAQVLAQVKPGKWEMYLEQWMGERGIEGAVEDEQEDDEDDDDDGGMSWLRDKLSRALV